MKDVIVILIIQIHSKNKINKNIKMQVMFDSIF